MSVCVLMCVCVEACANECAVPVLTYTHVPVCSQGCREAIPFDRKAGCVEAFCPEPSPRLGSQGEAVPVLSLQLLIACGHWRSPQFL